MEGAPANRCANCERLQKQVDQLQQAVAALTEQVRSLQEKLAAAGKNSSTSSKPPSSDIVKPAKPAPPEGQAKRSIGGQPGHPRHERALFPPGLLDGSFDHTPGCCPECGGKVVPLPGPPRVVQQVDIAAAPLVVHEHTGRAVWRPCCLKAQQPSFPAAVEAGGLLGPRLTTLVAYLKGVCHASYSTIRQFLRDVIGLPVSRGQLAKVVAKVSEALAGPYAELLAELPGQAALNVDETGHKDKGRSLWTWCFRAELYTLFKVDPRRSADVLVEVLGEEFDGVLGCDHFSAYRRFMRSFDVTVQFCLAHLIREVKFLTTLPGFDDVFYGVRLLEALKDLFGVIHRREQLTAGEFTRQLHAAKAHVLEVGTRDEGTEHTGRMAKRLRKYGEAYFTFLTTPGVKPTNNTAEQAIRFVVIDRLVTQGTRGEVGQRWSERMWTTLASCSQQGRSAFAFLHEAVRAYFAGEQAPSLLPQPG